MSYRHPRTAILFAIAMTCAIGGAAEAGQARSGQARAGEARRPATVMMPIGTPIAAPGGFLDFCRRSPDQCRTASTETVDVAEAGREATSLYWASVFGGRTASSAPASIRRAPGTISRPTQGSGLGDHDWSRTFAPMRRPTSSPAAAPSPVAAPIPAPGPASVPASVPEPQVVSAQAARPTQTPGPFNPMARFFARLEASTTPAVAESPARIEAAAVEVDMTAPAAETPSLAVSMVSTPVSAQAPSATVVSLDRDQWALLNAVNRSVNRRIREVSDQRAFGKADFWQAPMEDGATGDCEDFVLAKREALIEAGFPAEALSIAVVETRRGDVHAVLLVAGDAGEFVLDNLSPWIVRWDRAGYVWRERQAPGKVFQWVTIDA